MKKLYFIAAAAVAMVMSSCSTYSYTSRVTSVNRVDIQATQTLVDIVPDFTKKYTASSGRCHTKEEAMQEARYQVLTANKFDVIVDPIYKIERHPAGQRKWEVNIVCFGGEYANARSIFDEVKKVQNLSMEDIQKFLLLQDGSLMRFMQNANGDVITINHGNKNGECKKQHHEPAPAAPAPETKPAGKKK